MDNLQLSINEASDKANAVLTNFINGRGPSLDDLEQTNQAILALCGALQIVKQELEYKQNK